MTQHTMETGHTVNLLPITTGTKIIIRDNDGIVGTKYAHETNELDIMAEGIDYAKALNLPFLPGF